MALDTFNPYLFVSSGEQSNKFLTPTYADGIAQFQAQRAQELTGLTVRIDPIQEGTGDPSPTNIRPISGRTGLTVTAAGKNLLNGDNVTLTRDGTRDHFWNLGATIPAGTYAFSCDVSNATNAKNVVIGFRKTGLGTNYGIVNIPSGTSGRFSATVTISDSVDRLYVYISTLESSGVTITLSNPQVEFGTSASEYTPYVAPTTYPISWQTEAGTIYGGTLDVVSGVLTVTHAYKEYTGQASETWTESSWTKTNTFVAYSYVDLPNSKKEGSRYMCITACNMLPLMGYDELRNADTNGITITGGTTASYISIRIDKTVASTVAELQTYLASNPLTIVYELATPQIYQLTGAEVQTLPGFNQIYSDAGPVIDIKF